MLMSPLPKNPNLLSIIPDFLKNVCCKRTFDRPTLCDSDVKAMDFPSSPSGSGSSLFWLTLVIPLLLLASCGPTTETRVVDREARVTADDAELIEEEERRVLKIGEVNQIRSFDPLFAINTATKRVITLTYEGLVRFNEENKIDPAAAHSWEISDDSLRYTFHLREDLFFHDDESFSQGRGRRVNTRDVIRVFERMGSRDVPPRAAELFMQSIRGFEAFFMEQREVFLDSERRVHHIEGIQAEDNTTITFELLEPDPHFLEKLASPYAAIYPSEPFRFRDDGLHQHPVGTGPYRYSSSAGDSIHVFIRNNSYNRTDDQGNQLPRLHSIELLNVTDETRLYSRFSRQQLNGILELGPQSLYSLVDENNRLKPGMEHMYRLIRNSNPDPLILSYNPDNRFGLNRSDAAALIRNVDADTIRSILQYPSLEITFKEQDYRQANIGRIYNRFGEESENRLLFAFNQDIQPRILSANIYTILDENLNIDLIQRRVFSRDIFLYTDYLQTYLPETSHERQPGEIMRIQTDRYMLFDQQIDGILTNSLAWWIDLNHVNFTESEQPQ